MELPHLDQARSIASSPRIAIVGCGIAGLLSAVLLKRRFQVTLFEQSETLEPVGAGFLLQPVGQAVLDRAALLNPIRAQAAVVHDLRAQHVSGRELIRLPFQRRHHPQEHALGVHRGDIFQVLLNAARAAGVEPRTGARAISWDAAGHLQFANGTREGPFDLILAADGSRSALRAVLRPRVFEYGYSAMWTTLADTHTVAPHRLLQVVDGTHTLAGFLPVGANRVSLFWGLRPGERRESLRLEPWKARVREVCAAVPGAAPLLDQIHDFDQFRFAGYRAVHLRGLRHGPVVFLGDAAHSMTPHLGQGANLALLDAYILSRELLHHPSGRPLTEAADRYAALRRGQQQFYFLITTALSPFFQSGVPGLAMLRNLTLPWLPRVPWIGAEMAHAVTGFKSGFLGGSLDLPSI